MKSIAKRTDKELSAILKSLNKDIADATAQRYSDALVDYYKALKTALLAEMGRRVSVEATKS